MENVAEVKVPTTVKTNLAKDKKIVSIEEALEASNLNFIAQEDELMGATSGGIIAPNHKMIYRGDTNDVLGIVGKKYSTIQNFQSMSFFDTIVQQYGFSYTEAISKDNGAKTIIKAQSEKTEAIQVGDEIVRELVMHNSFDGSVGFQVSFNIVRLVCTNGLTSSSKKSSIKLRHTKTVHDRMAMAINVYDSSMTYLDEFISKSKVLAQTAVDKEMVEKFINGIFTDNKQNVMKRDKLIDLFQSGMGNNGSNAWELYNSVSEYTQHHYGKSDEQRLDYSTFGAGKTLNDKAWGLINTLV